MGGSVVLEFANKATIHSGEEIGGNGLGALDGPVALRDVVAIIQVIEPCL